MDKLTSLNYIHTIAKLRSISAAAEELGISQPALSSYLKKQEEEIGTILFDRRKQPLELTEAGELFIEYSVKFKALTKEFQQQIADLGELRRGSLSIGGASFFNVTYLPGAVSRFSAEYPGIELEIIDDKIPELSARALNGQLDLFITPGGNEDDRFCYEKLLEEHIFLCVPSQWEINDELKDKQILFEEHDGVRSIKRNEEGLFPIADFSLFKDLPFIVLSRGQNIGRKMAQLFEKYGFSPKRRISAEQTLTSLALTVAGAGMSLITESCLLNNELSIFANGPKIYMVDSDVCRRELFAAYPKNKYLSNAAAEFLCILKSSVKR